MKEKGSSLLKAKNKSIVEYLTIKGTDMQYRGERVWCSSPFSSDSNWSFVVYPNNTFYDWSNGKGGDIIDLVSLLENLTIKEAIVSLGGREIPTYEEIPQKKRKIKPFKLTNYLYRRRPQEVVAYAKERGILNYTAGKWMLNINKKWIEVPSLLFKHYDENFKIIGAKFRTVEGERERLESEYGVKIPKFNSRGRLGWHILENEVKGSFKKTVLYVMESETSATALYQYFKENKYPAVILCFGGVNNDILPIPEKYKGLKKFLLIDYDGDEEKFKERIENISLKDTDPIKLILKKGEDINSLYCEGEMYKVSYLLR